MTREEAEECIGIEFNPVRAGFHGGQDVWTRDVLNLGVRPDRAIAKVSHSYASHSSHDLLLGVHVCHYSLSALAVLPILRHLSIEGEPPNGLMMALSCSSHGVPSHWRCCAPSARPIQS